MYSYVRVRCDEARPECTVSAIDAHAMHSYRIKMNEITHIFQPCARLGHTCDYNPRLGFKDDTPRIMGKVSGASRPDGPVWDCMFLRSL